MYPCAKRWLLRLKKFLISLTAVLAILLTVCTIGGAAVLRAYPTDYRQTASAYHADWRLVLSLIKAESGFRADATSNAGACGLMQILPSTAEFIARKNGIEDYDLYDAQDNIRLGCLYLQYLEGRFADRTAVLAAYNAGEGTVRQWLKREDCSSDGIRLFYIPYSETEQYVKKIEKYYSNYRKIYLTNDSK